MPLDDTEYDYYGGEDVEDVTYYSSGAPNNAQPSSGTSGPSAGAENFAAIGGLGGLSDLLGGITGIISTSAGVANQDAALAGANAPKNYVGGTDPALLAALMAGNKPKPDNTITYVVIGFGALILVMLIFFMSRK